MLRYAAGIGRVFSEDDFRSFEALAGGNEHDLFLDPARPGRVLRVTMPDLGLRTGRRSVRGPTVQSYLKRWLLSNVVFGDDAWLEGVIPTSEGLRIVVSQPIVEAADEAASHSPMPEINEWLRLAGFEYDCGAWVREADGIVLEDTHAGNFVLSPDGIRPVDVEIRQLPDAVAKGIRIIPWAENAANPWGGE